MALSIEVKVIPSSGRSEVIIDKAGNIKCYLKSAPERGAANKELIKLIASKIGIAQQNIIIIAGGASRKKILKIETNQEKRAILEIFGICSQMGIFQ